MKFVQATADEDGAVVLKWQLDMRAEPYLVTNHLLTTPLCLTLSMRFSLSPKIRLSIFNAYYKITRVLPTLWLDEPNFLSEYRDTVDVIFILY